MAANLSLPTEGVDSLGCGAEEVGRGRDVCIAVDGSLRKGLCALCLQAKATAAWKARRHWLITQKKLHFPSRFSGKLCD